jgi:DUF4097 and DUF4098 domain-containing protein YvlB
MHAGKTGESRMTRILPLTLALAAAVAAPAFAATPINETRPLDARGRVEIENVKGRIQVRAWNRNEVRLTGSLGDGVEKLEIEGDRNDLRIEVRYPEGGWGGGNRSEPTTLVLQVPLQASLSIESVSAAVDVRGVAPRELDIESVSGDIVVAGAPGRAQVESVSGTQHLTLNSDGEVSTESVSGDITLRGRLKGALDAETVSGRVELDSAGEAVRSVSVNSVSGDIGARVALAGGGEIRGETVSGNLRLRLPKNLSARVNASTFSGTLSAPGAKVVREEFGPGASLDTRYGSGSGEISVETFSGDLTLSLD